MMKSIEHALTGIAQPAFATDTAGQVIAHNKSAERILSRSGTDLAKTAWIAELQASEAWVQGIASGLSFEASVSIGTALWNLHASALAGDKPDDLVWLVTLRPAGDGLLPAETLQLGLQAALAAGHMAMWEWDPHSGRAKWSATLYDILRLPPGSGDEAGDRFLALVHPDDAATTRAAVNAAYEQGELIPITFRIMAGDGTVRWLMSSAQAAKASDGSVTRLVGVNVDITDSVEAVSNLEKARASEQRQIQITQAVMENIPVGLAVAMCGEETLAYVSRFGTEMVGTLGDGPNDWDGWQVYHLDGVTPAKREEMALSRATRGETIRDEEWLIRTFAGRLVPVSCNAGPIYGSDGVVIGGIVAWHDVTTFKLAALERERLLKSERMARTAVEETSRARETFLASISHELRTPLSAIQGWAAVLRRTLYSDPKVLADGLEAIERNVRAQARIVDDLLDLSRIASGKLALDLQPAGLKEILDAAIETVSPAANAAQVTINAPFPEGTPRLMADALRLQQVFWNLLSNAVKFSREGGLIHVEVQTSPGSATVTVTDFGVGIEADQLNRVFERFWQAPNSLAGAGGLGLGLAIARHIVHEHGGHISATSPGVGQGAAFSVVLPLL